MSIDPINKELRDSLFAKAVGHLNAVKLDHPSDAEEHLKKFSDLTSKAFKISPQSESLKPEENSRLAELHNLKWGVEEDSFGDPEEQLLSNEDEEEYQKLYNRALGLE